MEIAAVKLEGQGAQMSLNLMAISDESIMKTVVGEEGPSDAAKSATEPIAIMEDGEEGLPIAFRSVGGIKAGMAMYGL